MSKIIEGLKAWETGGPKPKVPASPDFLEWVLWKSIDTEAEYQRLKHDPIEERKAYDRLVRVRDVRDLVKTACRTPKGPAKGTLHAIVAESITPKTERVLGKVDHGIVFHYTPERLAELRSLRDSGYANDDDRDELALILASMGYRVGEIHQKTAWAESYVSTLIKTYKAGEYRPRGCVGLRLDWNKG